MKESKIDTKLVAALRKLCIKFEAGSAKLKADALESMCRLAFSGIPAMRDYHDCLLFILAYPENEKLFKLAEEELIRIGQISERFSQSKSENKKAALSGTGIHGSYMVASFSYELVKWLENTFPGLVKYDSTDEEGIFQELLKPALFPAEFNLSEQRALKTSQWLLKSNSRKSKLLPTVLKLCERMPAAAEIRDLLYDQLKVFIRIDFKVKTLSRTFCKAPAGAIHYHDHLIREVDLIRESERAIQKNFRLTANEKTALVHAGKCILLSQYRETDPLTFSDTDATELIDCGRGFTVALYSLKQERRLPLESYVGYVAFKNRQPVAYGGSWLWGYQAKIGINVFPAYRGGESTYLLAQLIRVYRQRFGAEHFGVEPYQIGKGNPEGIQSGAFWFYYRLGFRPAQPDLFRIAESEYRLLRENKTHKTPASILRKLSGADLVFSFSDKGMHLTAARLSEMTTEYINRNYNGNRNILLKEAEKLFKQDFRNTACYLKNPSVSLNQRGLTVLFPVLLDSQMQNQAARRSILRWINERYTVSEYESVKNSQRMLNKLRPID